MKPLSRREFSSSLAAGAAGAVFGCQADTDDLSWTPQSHPQQDTDPAIRHHNNLGNTGIAVSDIILGGGALYESGVIRYAFDRGVNVFDTAAIYGSGVSEEVIGRGLRGVRDKAHIITKQRFSRRRPASQRAIADLLDTSLRKLQTDYVDGLFIHSMDNIDPLQNDDVFESFIRFKRQGKVRFTGFSTHNERRTLTACMEPRYEEFVDVVMLRYNHMEGQGIEPQIAAMRDKGIGIIAMKTLAGGKHGRLEEFVNDRMSYPQAAIRWVLANENVDCAVLSMDTYSLVDTYVSASGPQPHRSDNSALHKYRDAVANSYCRVTCTACESSCPHSVAISDVMRFGMYFEDYGQRRKALDNYAALSDTHKPLSCKSCCGRCTNACPYGLPVKDRMIKTHSMLTV